MARPLRIEFAGGWFHITSRGNERRATYRDHRDREHFCQLLAETVERFRVRLRAYVLMDNHYHLLLELTEPNLSRAIQWLNVSYSVWFNRRHGRGGHLFQGRFKSIVVDPCQWGLALSRHVHLNPVRIGQLGLSKAERRRSRAGAASKPDQEVVKERISQLRRHRWSSYPAYGGFGKPPEWLECEAILQMAGGRREEASRRYRRYVEESLREGTEESPWEKLTEQVILGGKEFLSKLRSHVAGNAREQLASKRLTVSRPALEEVVAGVERAKKEKWEEFRDRHGDSGRDMVLYLGRRHCGLKLNELARFAKMKDYSAASAAVRYFERRLQRSKALREEFKQACQFSNLKM
jgi:putative transposase